jgi:hypothetical protein
MDEALTLIGKITDVRYSPQVRLQELKHYASVSFDINHAESYGINVTYFKGEFTSIYRKAVESYQSISKTTGVVVRSESLQLRELAKYSESEQFSLEAFKTASLEGSFKAAQRELLTLHKLEQLADGRKGYFSITNMLGGEYHLTADEICFEDERLIIQESKNSSKGKFPALDDVQDGFYRDYARKALNF